jgi:hypothetical protein
MANMSYQYGTNPRKYELEYTNKKSNKKSNKTPTKKVSKKETERKRLEKEKIKKAEDRKKKAKQVIIVMAIFGMLLAISYREILIMEMFNQKKDLESQLALIEKEKGQVEKSVKEVESTLDWNKIKQIATEQLGMETKTGQPIDLEKSDSVETESTFIKEEKTSIIEKIVEFIINR